MKKDIFIFLDIDGVLNTSDQWIRMYQLNHTCVSHFARFVKSLKADVRVILTSSWKNGFDPAGNHTPQIKELLDLLSVRDIPVVGKTESRADGDRAKEINDFISSHHLEKEKCIVIDDDKDLFLSPLAKNCSAIWTDAKKGFVSPKVKNLNKDRFFLELFDYIFSPPY